MAKMVRAASSPSPFTTPCTFAIWSAHVRMPAAAIHLRSCTGKGAWCMSWLHITRGVLDSLGASGSWECAWRLGSCLRQHAYSSHLTLPAALRCAGLRNVRVRLPSVSEICRDVTEMAISGVGAAGTHRVGALARLNGEILPHIPHHRCRGQLGHFPKPRALGPHVPKSLEKVVGLAVQQLEEGGIRQPRRSKCVQRRCCRTRCCRCWQQARSNCCCC